MLTGSLDCAQRYKDGTTHRCRLSILCLVSFPLSPVSTCMFISVPATEGPRLRFMSWGLGSGFSALDKPVKGWEVAGVAGTLLQGLRAVPPAPWGCHVLGSFGQQWPTWNPFLWSCASPSALEPNRPGRFWVGLWAHPLPCLSQVHAAPALAWAQAHQI